MRPPRPGAVWPIAKICASLVAWLFRAACIAAWLGRWGASVRPAKRQGHTRTGRWTLSLRLWPQRSHPRLSTPMCLCWQIGTLLPPYCSILATPGWGLGCVCLGTGFGRAQPFLAGVGCVCVWVLVFPALRFFWFGCWGVWPLVCAPSVALHPLVRLPVAWGCAGAAMGGVCPPPFLFFSSFPAAGRGVVLGPVVSWLCGACCCLSWSWASWPPPPFTFRLGCIVAPFSFVCPPAFGGVHAGVSGVSFPPVGCCSRLRVPGFGWVVLWCSFGGPRGYRLWCCLAGGSARLLWSGCAVSRLCICLLPPSFFFVGAFLVWRGFPPFCAVCLSLLFWGGGSPVPPSAFPGLVQALVGIRCG